MSKVKCERVSEGRVASEKVVRILTADGIEEEVLAAPEQIKGDYIFLPEITAERDRILFELPQESSSGQWRLWINRDKVEAGSDSD